MKYIELKNYIEYIRINLEDGFNNIKTLPKELLFTNMEVSRTYANAINNNDLLFNRDIWQFEEIKDIFRCFRYITYDKDRVILISYLNDALNIIKSVLESNKGIDSINKSFMSRYVHDSLKEILDRCNAFILSKDYTRCYEVLKSHIGEDLYNRLKNNISVLDYDLVMDVFGLLNDIGFNQDVFNLIVTLKDRSEIALCKNMLIIIKQLHLSNVDTNIIFELILNKQFADLEKKYYDFVRYVPNFVNFDAQLDELSMKHDIFSDHLNSALKIYDKVINSSPLYEYTWINSLEVLYPYKNKYKNYEIEKTVEVNIGKSRELSVRDKQKEQITDLLYLGMPVMLVGPYGCGKESLFNSAALEYAKRYGKEFIYRSGYRFKSIDEFNGVYSFLFKNGGIFYLKGYDSTLQEIVDEINSSRKYQVISDVRCGNELVSESLDFRLGVGVDTYDYSKSEYCGDTILRVTDIDKYVMIDVDYDDVLEESLLENDKHLYNYIKEARSILSSNKIKHFITTGDIVTAKKLIDSGKYSREDILKMVILKNLSIDALTTIEKEMSAIFKGTNPYNSALSLVLKNKKIRTTT